MSVAVSVAVSVTVAVAVAVLFHNYQMLTETMGIDRCTDLMKIRKNFPNLHNRQIFYRLE